jgi:hypothetical protein
MGQRCWSGISQDSTLTKVLLDLDRNAHRLRGLHVLAQVLANIVHVLLQELVVIPCRIQLWLAQSILRPQRCVRITRRKSHT